MHMVINQSSHQKYGLLYSTYMEDKKNYSMLYQTQYLFFECTVQLQYSSMFKTTLSNEIRIYFLAVYFVKHQIIARV